MMAIGFGLIMFVVCFVIDGLVASERSKLTIDTLTMRFEHAQRELDLMYADMNEDTSWDDYDEDMNAIYE